MKRIYSTAVLVLMSYFVFAQKANKVEVQKDASGMKLMVDGNPFIVNGMNWDYFPIGTNYEYSLWSQPEKMIKGALDYEMTLLKDMGVNVIRVYVGIPPEWITYIYENYGIFTMLNHSFGRYGLSLGGAWIGNTEYSDPRVKELLISEITELAEQYKDTPGLLFYLLGNENNYGLFWEGAETENLPLEQQTPEGRAKAMYSLFNQAALKMKAIDSNHPIVMCNGDLQFLEIIKEECKDLDVYGTNMYRGVSFGDAFERVKTELNKPILITEFGGDAYNAIKEKEDQLSQAYYMVGNWKEIYQNVAGQEGSDNSIGGFTFQFSDGWWKFGQTWNLDKHDNNASWANGGYQKDFQNNQNNMNEEWFGVCRKGATNYGGYYNLYPRAAYYALQEVHKLNPYSKKVNAKSIEAHFADIKLDVALEKAEKAFKGE